MGSRRASRVSLFLTQASVSSSFVSRTFSGRSWFRKVMTTVAKLQFDLKSLTTRLLGLVILNRFVTFVRVFDRFR